MAGSCFFAPCIRPDCMATPIETRVRTTACDEMHSRLGAADWVKVLARPRKFVRGDPLPAEICERINTGKILVLSTAIGFILPDPLSNFVMPGIGMTMMHPTVKRRVIRWAADKLAQRHVLLDGEAADELLYRLEINTLGSQWIPLAVFRLSQAEFDIDDTPGSPPAITFTQTLGSRIIGPSNSKAEALLRSNTLSKAAHGVQRFIKVLDPHVRTDTKQAMPVVEYRLWLDAHHPNMLHQRIRVLEDGVVVSEANREEAVLAEQEPAETTDPTVEAARLEASLVTVEIAPGPLGIGYEGNRVVTVTPNGQGEKGGVKVGMRIQAIDGLLAANDSLQIKAALTRLKKCSASFKVVFVKPQRPDGQ